MIVEEWKEIDNYNSYQVSNKGRVKNNNILLNPYKRKGYLFVTLCNKTSKKQVRVHRLVGFYFVDNPNNYPDINHKDEVKDNNIYTNLEWCTKQYNNTYGTRIEKQQKALFIKVQKYSKDNILLEEYKSINEAGVKNNILPCNITNTLQGRQRTAGGFIWKYK